VFYSDLEKTLTSLHIKKEHKIVIGGDWNVISNIELDKMGGTKDN